MPAPASPSATPYASPAAPNVRECTAVHLTAPRRLLFPAVPPPQPKQRARRGTPWMELLLVRDLVTLGVLTGLFAVVLVVLDATRSRP